MVLVQSLVEASPQKNPARGGFKPGGIAATTTACAYTVPMPPPRSESKSASCRTPTVLAVRSVTPAAATRVSQVCERENAFVRE